MTPNSNDGERPRQKRDIHAVAFDLDGLMFNTEDLYDEVLDELLIIRGQRFSRELKLQVMGLPSLEAAAVMIRKCGLDDEPRDLITEAHHMLAQLLPDRIAPMPGLLELLNIVESAGLPKSVATSSSPVFANQALATSGLNERFQFVLTADDVQRGKPNPDIYIESARRHEVSIENLLVLEDSMVGSRAGVAAGAITVAVPGHHSAEQDFGHVDFRFDSLGAPELQGMIRGRKVQ